MREDFEIAKNELMQIGIVGIARDLIAEPIERGGKYWLHSPSTEDRNASLLLRVSDNRYTDFAFGNKSGDAISLYSYFHGCSQWESLQRLRDFYHLGNNRTRYDRTAIERQRAELQRKQREEQEFRAAWRRKADELKAWLHVLDSAIEQSLYEPFSDLWAYVVEQKTKTEYRLDTLCNLPNRSKNPSEYEEWRKTALKIMEEVS